MGAELVRFLEEISIRALLSVAPMCVMLLIMISLERRVTPARPRESGPAWFNVRYGIVMLVLNSALQPLLPEVSLALTRTLGAGWISFEEGIAGWCLALLAVLLTTDLLEYLIHRAQHAFPVLWKMHELHHSAEHFDVTLTYRHFWVEPLLRAACLFPLVGVLFKVPPSVGAAAAIIFLINNHVAHMNLRYSPRFALLIQHPQYHRLHHSRHERDRNKNFSNLFPLWDILFGTLRRPESDEFVDVGLGSGDAPHSLWQALLWPWCRMRQASTPLERVPRT